MPDLSCSNISDYYENIAQYLFFKENPFETFEIENEDIKNINYKNFLKEIKNNFNKYYGDYISAILRDIPSFIIPAIRIAQNTYIKQLIDLKKIKYIDNEEFIKLSNGNSIAKYFFCMTKNFNNFKSSSKFEVLKNELFYFDNLLDGLKVILLLRNGGISLRDDIEEIKNFFETKGNIYQFLDKPHSNLFFDIIINQLAYPMHNNVCQNVRFEYVAKTNHMFTDITVYDECRYIYEWLPGLHQIVTAFKDLSWQYVFRFALDGLVKMRQNYNNEFFYQGSVISKYIEEFSSKSLSIRKFVQ